MRVIHVVPWWTFGGAETAIANIARGSVHDHAVFPREILSPHPKPLDCLPIVSSTEGADIIHVHHLSEYHIHKFDPRPRVFTVHGFAGPPTVVQPRDVIVATSQSVFEFVMNNGMKVDAVIYPGVDFKKFCIDEGPNDSHFRGLLDPPPSPVVLWVGRICPGKGVDLLADIIRLMPDYNFIVIGEDYLAGNMGKVPQHIQDALLRNPNVTWVRYVEHDDMPAFYRMADVTISTSTREGYGLTIAESMACGTPCVVPSVLNLKRLVFHGEGGYVSPRSAAWMDVWIRRCISSIPVPASSESVRDSLFEGHSLEVTCSRYDRVYDRLGKGE